MSHTVPTHRRLLAGILFLGAALAINGLIFGMAPWLVSETINGALSEPLRMVAMFKPTPPPPPPEEKTDPPDPPPEIKQLETVKPRSPQNHKPKPELELTHLDLDINPQLSSGPALPAPPPAPKLKPGKLDRGPLVASRVPPMYPYIARLRAVEGWVKVRFLVNRQGRVQELSILAAKPEGYFEESVLRSVNRWRFKPALKQGQPKEAWMETTIRFELE